MSEPNYNVVANSKTRTCQIEDKIIRCKNKIKLKVETSRFLLVKQSRSLV